MLAIYTLSSVRRIGNTYEFRRTEAQNLGFFTFAVRGTSYTFHHFLLKCYGLMVTLTSTGFIGGDPSNTNTSSITGLIFIYVFCSEVKLHHADLLWGITD